MAFSSIRQLKAQQCSRSSDPLKSVLVVCDDGGDPEQVSSVETLVMEGGGGVLETNAEKTVMYAHTRQENVVQNQKPIPDRLVTLCIRFV